MEKTISIIADVCGILGFIISLFAINGVVKINNRISSSGNISNVQRARGKDNDQRITNK